MPSEASLDWNLQLDRLRQGVQLVSGPRKAMPVRVTIQSGAFQKLQARLVLRGWLVLGLDEADAARPRFLYCEMEHRPFHAASHNTAAQYKIGDVCGRSAHFGAENACQPCVAKSVGDRKGPHCMAKL